MNLRIIKSLDKTFGAALCIFLGMINSLFKKELSPKEKIKNILVVQLWGIGETILTVPSIKELKKRYNQASVDVLCTYRNNDVYFNYPFITTLKVMDISPLAIIRFILKNYRKYDIVIDMEEYLNISALISFFAGKYVIGYSHGARSLLYSKKVKYNSNQHVSSTFFDLVRALGIEGRIDQLERLNYTNTDKKIVDMALATAGIKLSDFIVGIAPGAAESSRSRMWPKENFARLIEGIFKKRVNAKIIFVGADYEKTLGDSIINLINDKNARRNSFNFAGRFTLKQTFYLISRCNVLVSNDSGPMHIGAAMDVKTIGLFGPNLPVRFSPLNRKSNALYKKVSCSPCINVHKGKVLECVFRKDNENYQKCMKEIKVKEVLKYI